ncbi:unnamed protein product [Lactuca virosa]|uniref:Uncharacterized protein n=1 Tax=Lactuca virosa TaxID=75947 RepID=A0AAU9NW40_9ASTR|nr:unnamed protein product [Lactuca virosa]
MNTWDSRIYASITFQIRLKTFGLWKLTLKAGCGSQMLIQRCFVESVFKCVYVFI